MNTDALLLRRLYLQRYITALSNDIVRRHKDGDRLIVMAMADFVSDAGDRDLQAFARRRTRSNLAMAAHAEIRQVVANQKRETLEVLNLELPELAQQEVHITAKAVDAEREPPSSRGVATLPIAGIVAGTIITALYNRYAMRLIGDLSEAVTTDPAAIGRILRGSKTQNRRDGLFRWRDDRLLRADLDRIASGVAANAAQHVYQAYEIEMVEHLATLDYRTCPSCVTAESNGPYELGKQPFIPVHPRCRCLNVPAFDESHERPFVKDDRSVKKIPKSDRKGKIGKTRDSIDQFFARMNKSDLRAYLGKTRYELWKAGKIKSIKDLVSDVSLRPLRLDELPEL